MASTLNNVASRALVKSACKGSGCFSLQYMETSRCFLIASILSASLAWQSGSRLVNPWITRTFPVLLGTRAPFSSIRPPLVMVLRRHAGRRSRSTSYGNAGCFNISRRPSGSSHPYRERVPVQRARYNQHGGVYCPVGLKPELARSPGARAREHISARTVKRPVSAFVVGSDAPVISS